MRISFCIKSLEYLIVQWAPLQWVDLQCGYIAHFGFWFKPKTEISDIIHLLSTGRKFHFLIVSALPYHWETSNPLSIPNLAFSTLCKHLPQKISVLLHRTTHTHTRARTGSHIFMAPIREMLLWIIIQIQRHKTPETQPFNIVTFSSSRSYVCLVFVPLIALVQPDYHHRLSSMPAHRTPYIYI